LVHKTRISWHEGGAESRPILAKSNTDIDFEEKPDGAEGRKYKPTPENYVIII